MSNVGGAAGVCREPLRRCGFFCLGHPLPDANRPFEIVTGARHRNETDMLGLRLLVAAEGEEDAKLCAQSIRGVGIPVYTATLPPGRAKAFTILSS